MLSSIHPFGERSRNNRFWLTATAHIVGSVVGGTALGLIAGAIGLATTVVWAADSVTRAIALGLIAAAATLVDALGRERHMPSRSRQVNENWIQNYRGWIYGGGFGVELGFGVSTIITTTLVHVMLSAMVLIGSLPMAVAIGATFGLIRGSAVLTSIGIDSPEALRSFHRSLDRFRSRSRLGGVAALTLTSLIGLSAVVW